MGTEWQAGQQSEGSRVGEAAGPLLWKEGVDVDVSKFMDTYWLSKLTGVWFCRSRQGHILCNSWYDPSENVLDII